jgi:hypothetical protein
MKESGGDEFMLIHISVTGGDLLNDIGSFRLTRSTQ